MTYKAWLGIVADLKGDMDNYLGNLKESKVKSLQELVDWNFAHAEEALTAGMSTRTNYSSCLTPQ